MPPQRHDHSSACWLSGALQYDSAAPDLTCEDVSEKFLVGSAGEKRVAAEQVRLSGSNDELNGRKRKVRSS